jgi:hypothetical protein
MGGGVFFWPPRAAAGRVLGTLVSGGGAARALVRLVGGVRRVLVGDLVGLLFRALLGMLAFLVHQIGIFPRPRRPALPDLSNALRELWNGFCNQRPSFPGAAPAPR